MTITTSNAYYVVEPSTEYPHLTVYVVEPQAIAAFGETYPNAKEVTRDEAIELGWTQPQALKAAGVPHKEGFNGPREATTLDEALVESAEYTSRELGL